MEFSISKESFVSGLKKVVGVVGNRATLPILMGIKLEIKMDKLQITGSDGDGTISTLLTANDGLSVLSDGAVVVPKNIVQTVSKMKDDTIHCRLGEGMIVLSSKKAEIDFPIQDAEEFPNLPKFNLANPTFVLKGTEFKELFSRAIVATSTSETRPILTGVNVKASELGIEVVATDSHRLVKEMITGTGEFNVVIAAKAIDIILKTLDVKEDVQFFANNNMIAVRQGMTFYFSRLLEGNYPDVSRLIPSDFKASVSFAKQEIIDSLELLKEVSEGGTITLEVTPEGIVIQNATKSQKGKGKTSPLPFISYDGEEIRFGASIIYLLDALKSLSNEVELLFSESMRPFIFRNKGQDTMNHIHLLLPVRTN